MAVEHPEPARGTLEIERRILFHHRIGTPLKYRREALDIAQWLNMALSVAKVPTYIRIQRLSYNEKGNLGSLMAPASASSMLLPQHQELVLKMVRQLDQYVTNSTGDQRWYKIRLHGVDIYR